MNSRFKFRIWNKAAKCFVSQYENISGENRLKYFINVDGSIGRLIYGLVEGESEDNIVAPEDYVIQQYTGSLDENGMEIYEGDILDSKGNYITDERDDNGKFPNLFCVVVWNSHMSRFGLVGIDKYNDYKNDSFARIWSCPITTFKEIIGNIFENPELLNNL